MYYVYALIDPVNNRIRYIGQSNNPNRRYAEHLLPSRLHNRTIKNNWIKSLLSTGYKPKIEILEICSEDTVDEREVFWIKIIPELTNDAKGGSYYKSHSLQTIDKLRRSGVKHPNYNKTMSIEQRNKISKALRGRPVSENTRTAFSKYAASQGEYWRIETPDGDILEVFNLSKFCRERGLSQSHMSSVSLGNRKSHKGYKCSKVDK